MKVPTEAKLLRIHIGENDKYQGKPLYEAIIEQARRRGIAGATVLRGVLGYGAKSRLHSAKILRLSEDLPLVIEIVDVAEKIEALRSQLDEMIQEGLVTIENVQAILYRPNTT